MQINMNEQQALKAIQRGAFAELNGQIMRVLVILRDSERTINSVYSLFKDSHDASELQKSISYLHDSGYISIGSKTPDSCVEEIQAGSFTKVKAKLTPAGTRLMEGVTEDECVMV